MEHKEVLKYKDVVIRESDLDTVREPCFLTDQIIAFYFSYLSSSCETDDILLVPPMMSFLLANSEDVKAVSEFAESSKLSSKRLALFPVNDCYDFEGDDRGLHWSVLVYSRPMNAFLHLDSMGGANNLPAEKLYDAVKNYVGVGGDVSRKQTSSSLKKQRNKSKKVQPVSKPLSDVGANAPAGLPLFKECKDTPQQSNGYDCGIYVLAIARAIVEEFSNGMERRRDVLELVRRQVDQSVEVRMRQEILDLVHDLKNGSAQ